MVEKSLLKLCTGYVYDELKTIVEEDRSGKKRTKIEKTRRHQPPSAQANSFFIRNRCPEEWSDKKELILDTAQNEQARKQLFLHMHDRENHLIQSYLSKHFDQEQIIRLIREYSFSELRRLLGEIDIEFFALCYFPKYFDHAFGSFHKELFTELKYTLNNTGLIEAFGLPREHGKSTINLFLFPLYSTLYKKSQFTLIISATEQVALPFLDMIKDELENNQLLLENFGVTKGNRWNNNEIWIRGRNALDVCIMICGIHFKQHRPQLVLLDDLLKDDTAKRETKRETIKNTFTDVVIPIGTNDTNILVVGTVLHEEDLMADLLKGKIPWVRNIRKSVILSFSDRDDLWDEWERMYNNLADPERLETAKVFFSFPSGGNAGRNLRPVERISGLLLPHVQETGHGRQILLQGTPKRPAIHR